VSRTTYQNALAELFGLLADANGNPVASLASSGAVKVFPHEPGAGGWVKPCSVTMWPSGMTPYDWTVTLRVYVADVDPATAQDLLIDNAVVIDSLLLTGAGYGPSNWAFGWSPELGCYVGTSEVMVGREDGF